MGVNQIILKVLVGVTNFYKSCCEQLSFCHMRHDIINAKIRLMSVQSNFHLIIEARVIFHDIVDVFFAFFVRTMIMVCVLTKFLFICPE